MARRLKMALELASNIGASAADLHNGYGDTAAVEAFRFLWTVNPEMFAWLRDRLIEAGPLGAGE